MDVAAAQVHPVGERVRELRRDRPDLAPQPSEVVQQPRSLRRQLLQQPRESQHVHCSESTPPQSSSERRSLFVCERRFFASSRRSRDAAEGFVATRRRSTFSACAELLDEPLDGQLAVAPLAPLVLGDAAQHRAGLRRHAPLLRVRQRRRRLDVEHGLDARLGRVRVLAARAARAREAQLDLRRAAARPTASPE